MRSPPEKKAPPADDEPGRRSQKGLWQDQRQAGNSPTVAVQTTHQSIELQDVADLPARFRDIFGFIVAEPYPDAHLDESV